MELNALVLAPDHLMSPAVTRRPDAGRLRRLLDANGGFTVDRHGRANVRSGIAVCAEPSLALSLVWDRWQDHDVAAWLVAVRPRLAAGDVHLGGWHDDEVGSVWLEPVWVLPEHLRPAALALARLHGQRAVFDLRAQRLIVVPLGEHERTP